MVVEIPAANATIKFGLLYPEGQAITTVNSFLSPVRMASRRCSSETTDPPFSRIFIISLFLQREIVRRRGGGKEGGPIIGREDSGEKEFKSRKDSFGSSSGLSVWLMRTTATAGG